MTPKQKLLHDIGMPDADETLGPIINRYAIGRWVSVEERLPSDGFMGQCKHYVYGTVLMICQPCDNQFGTVYGNGFVSSVCVATEITHWLELEMPGGEG